MLKFHRQAGGVICPACWKRTFLVCFILLLLLCLCVQHCLVAFHLHLNTGFVIQGRENGSFGLGLIHDVSPRVTFNRGPVMYALREGTSMVRVYNNNSAAGKNKEKVQVKISWTSPSLDRPPFNVTEEERIKWFKNNLRSFKILHPDELSAQFSGKVKGFFKNCKPRFFMTWISHPKSFGPRELLSVESVFKWHPSACLLIISRTMDSKKGEQILRPFVTRGLRVMAAAPDLGFLFKGTPAEAWLRVVAKGDIDPGEISFAQNLSNILRLAALYKYGGIYIDSDIIILKLLSKLRNAIGAQNVDPDNGTWNRLNNAVLMFDKGHPLVWKFIQEFALTFNGNKWGHNGPYLVTRVVTRVANRPGYDFQVLPPMAFYPVDWTRIYRYFKHPDGNVGIKWISAKLLQMENETYAVHLWNKQSRQLEVEKDSIIHHIFNKCCLVCDHRHFFMK
ncbi:uncharacterized protein At4g19900 [Cryptomeria japonica]|uniref:uncharacterized protein At4g19900 n=1 Tax=Cryptomeria japonica TaxID=3369 RepID=UPI0027DA1D68|nr:uncharacterized protein At4g19900 [Cryptomeria japonica]